MQTVVLVLHFTLYYFLFICTPTADLRATCDYDAEIYLDPLSLSIFLVCVSQSITCGPFFLSQPAVMKPACRSSLLL